MWPGQGRAARNYLSSSTLVCYDAQIKSNDTRTHLVRYLTFTAEGSKTEKRKCLQRSLRTFLYVLRVLVLKCDIVHRCHNNKHNDIRNNVKEISSSLWTHVTIVSSSQHVSRIVAPVNGNRRVTWPAVTKCSSRHVSRVTCLEIMTETNPCQSDLVLAGQGCAALLFLIPHQSVSYDTSPASSDHLTTDNTQPSSAPPKVFLHFLSFSTAREAHCSSVIGDQMWLWQIDLVLQRVMAFNVPCIIWINVLTIIVHR